MPEDTSTSPGAGGIGPRQATGFALLAGVTVASLVLPVRALLEASGPLTYTTVVEAALPALVAVGIAALVVALVRQDTAADPLRTALWSLGGWAFFGLLAAFILAHQTHRGVLVVERWLVINNTALGGALVGGLVGWYDAERRVDHRRARRLGRRLTFLNRMLRHDVRNDVGIVIGNAELLEDALGEDERIAYIKDAAEHVVELTHLAQAFEEAEEGHEVEPVPLDEVLVRCLTTARESFPQAEIEADVSQAEGVRVTADPLLASVFENLIRNAVQHHDGDEPWVGITATVDAEVARVEVADDGPGIPDAVQAEMFQEGAKGEASAGTGMGLHLVDTLVTQYGGTVAVRDRRPRGTVFTVELPLAEDPSDEADGDDA